MSAFVAVVKHLLLVSRCCKSKGFCARLPPPTACAACRCRSRASKRSRMLSGLLGSAGGMTMAGAAGAPGLLAFAEAAAPALLLEASVPVAAAVSAPSPRAEAEVGRGAGRGMDTLDTTSSGGTATHVSHKGQMRKMSKVGDDPRSGHAMKGAETAGKTKQSV